MEPICEATILTGLGEFTIRCSERGIREIAFGAARKSSKFRNGRQSNGTARAQALGHRTQAAVRSRQWSRRATRELKEYAAGERKKFTVPLDPNGTTFQKKIWKTLRTIPYGQTRSYGEIARLAGNPRAARAVGMANRENPIAIVVPCHRVIASDGSLGGYAGGLKRKSAMLNLEKAHA